MRLGALRGRGQSEAEGAPELAGERAGRDGDEGRGRQFQEPGRGQRAARRSRKARWEVWGGEERSGYGAGGSGGLTDEAREGGEVGPNVGEEDEGLTTGLTVYR
jgi:hypothetical protein